MKRTVFECSIFGEIVDAAALRRAAEDRMRKEGIAEIDDYLGTPEEPNLSACLTMLLDPGALHEAGIEIHDSITELEERE